MTATVQRLKRSPETRTRGTAKRPKKKRSPDFFSHITSDLCRHAQKMREKQQLADERKAAEAAAAAQKKK